MEIAEMPTLGTPMSEKVRLLVSSDIPKIRRLGHYLSAEADRADQALDLDPNWERDLEQIKRTNKEFDEEVNVLRALGGRLARDRRVAKADFHVQKVTRVVILLALFDFFAGIMRLWLVAALNPGATGVFGVGHEVG